MHKHNKDFYRLKNEDMTIVKSIVTKERVEKVMRILICKGEISESCTLKDMKQILEKLPFAVFIDCMKEEPLITNKIEHFALYLKELVVQHAKEILKE